MNESCFGELRTVDECRRMAGELPLALTGNERLFWYVVLAVTFIMIGLVAVLVAYPRRTR